MSATTMTQTGFVPRDYFSIFLARELNVGDISLAISLPPTATMQSITTLGVVSKSTRVSPTDLPSTLPVEDGTSFFRIPCILLSALHDLLNKLRSRLLSAGTQWNALRLASASGSGAETTLPSQLKSRTAAERSHQPLGERRTPTLSTTLAILPLISDRRTSLST